MALDNPLTRQWLDLIAYAEGTDPSRSGRGYDVLFGGGRFSDLSKHPDRVIRTESFPRGSAAAGRYQFMPGTWAGLGLGTSFGPQQQDLGAIELMRRRGVDPTKDPITAQNIAKLAPEWASLPTLQGRSYYGQPVKPLKDLYSFLQRPSAGISYQVDPTVQTERVNLPRYDFKGAVKDIVSRYVLAGGGAESYGDPNSAQVYLNAAAAIEQNPEKYGEEGLALAEQYKLKANEALFMGGGSSGNDPSKLVMDIVGAKMSQKAFDTRQASAENYVNSVLASQSPSAVSAVDPNAQFISTAELGQALLRRYGQQGLRVGEHPAFGRVGRHSEGSLHYQGRALDITDWGSGDWKARTVQLGRQLQQALPGAEIFHPGYDPVGGHHEHIHLGLPQGRIQLTPQLRGLLG